MAKRIPVSYEDKHCYDIVIQKDFSGLLSNIKTQGILPTQKVCVITDSNVSKIYGSEMLSLLETYFEFCTLFTFQAGEEHKNLGTVEKIYQHLIDHSFDRKDILIALGGGVTGDITGFAASSYLRGIDFIQIPTTLLSQVDSSIGGKTGVDFLQYKNIIGAFYMPKLVYINLSVLTTLSQRQFYSGMSEIIKHGLIKDEHYFQFIKGRCEKICDLDMDVLEELIYRSCEIKREVVQKDPKEKGERALLNFGHTVGHAIERLSNFSLTHGECVALGSVCAGYISYKKGNITEANFKELEQVFLEFHLPVKLKDVSFTDNDIYETTKKDKKMEIGKIKFVLLNDIGNAYITNELLKEDILVGINYLMERLS